MTPEIFTRSVLAFAVILGFTGCAAESIRIEIDPYSITPGPPIERSSTQVEVTDIREHQEMARTAMGVHLSDVTLKPDAEEIIRILVQGRLDQFVAQNPGTSLPGRIIVGIRTFDIATPSTALYWDVTASIEIVVRINATDYDVKGSATDRTYVWPSQEMMTRVTNEALRNVSTDLGAVLVAHFAQVFLDQFNNVPAKFSASAALCARWNDNWENECRSDGRSFVASGGVVEFNVGGKIP